MGQEPNSATHDAAALAGRGTNAQGTRTDADQKAGSAATSSPSRAGSGPSSAKPQPAPNIAGAPQVPDNKPTVVGLAPLNENVLRQISALEDEKERRTPAQKKMDSGLVHLAKKSRGEVISAATPNLEVDVKANEKGLVLVDLSADVSEELLSAIATAGGRVINQFAAFHAIRAELPVQAMEVLAVRDDVKSIAPAALAITNVGSALSQGDRTHRADAVRALYGGSGAGLKIGVLSDGVNSLAASKASGNLNSLATFLSGQAGSGDEGTAMMEIIQDIVPDAQLIFATGVTGDTVMAANIIALQAAGCSVIVDDIGYFNESPFQDMVISQAVNTVSAAGAMYFSSARNSGNKNDGTSGTWEGDFVSAGAVAAPVTGSGLVLDFGGATAFNTVASGGSSRRMDFFWADPLGASANDYDVFILDSTGTTVLRSSTNVQSGTQNAYEASGTLNIGERIVVVQRSGAANRFLHLDTGRAVLTISTQGSTRGHNAPVAPNGFCVAATNVANSPSPSVFTGGVTNPVETFSSDGPRRMFYDPSGTPYTPGNFSSTGGTVFVKPDIAAADGVTTTVPGFTSFFGTSAAAPHAAAIAAMIKSYNPALTPAQIRTAMTSTALDIEAVGSDRDSGAGIVMAYQAVASLPLLDNLVVSAATFSASGFVGGPFAPTSATYTLTNLGAVPVNWTAAKTQTWNSLSATSGTLAPSGSTTVTWSLGAGVNALAVGGYADTLTFTDAATSYAITKSMTLTVIGYPEIVIEQPEGSGLTDGVSTVAYGNVFAGANLTKRFAIKNIGLGPMTLSGASIAGTHAADFALGTFTATTVAPGATAYLDVSFRPVYPNSKSAALHILSSDVDEASFDIALTGFGATPGGPVMLARDINITPNGLSPASPVVIGAQEFFLGTTVNEGQELWRTDGTAVGTFMVKDINSGTAGSTSSGLTSFSGALFFSANGGITGQELWKSDGTGAGTVLVKDINATVGLGSSPGNLTVIGSTLFFSANESTNGTELWKSDGTTAGTVLVANIAAGATSSAPSNLRAVGSTLFFTANDAINGIELWKSDGTAAGTVLVKDIVAGVTSSSPTNLTAVGSTLFFTVNDTVNGVELWKSDGTTAGTVLVKDINTGVASSSPTSLAEFGGVLYFSATTVNEGAELWKSDGSTAGTVMLKDILAGTSSSTPSLFLNAGGVLYFSAFDTAGRELWKTDGTAAGTVMVKDVFDGSSSSTPTGLTLVGSTLYFQAGTSSSGAELWKSDGTAAGTVLVKDISPGTSSSSPASLASLSGMLVFAANDGLNGQELWRSDGTEAGTVQLIEGQPGSSSSAPSFFRNVNGTLYFSAFDGGAFGTELWKSDGSVAGTVMVSNINTLIGGSSSPGSLTNIGSTLYFSANDGTNGAELWKSDGTSPGTVMVSNINASAAIGSSPANLTPVGSTLFFSASDSTANGTELWKSDGTAAGTVMVLNINPTANTGSNPSNLTVVGSTLFFTASDSTANGTELWKSDGTAGGTALVLNINPVVNSSSSPANLTDFNGTLFFAAGDGTNGTELWKSDGTAGGTVLVKDINTGAVSSSPANLRVIGSTLFFTATTAANGQEVWKTDGTAAGTVMVADINPGTGSSSPSSLTVSGTTLYFAAITTANGSELWKTDGTAPGTVMVTEIVPGASGAGPSGMVSLNGLIYFSAFATATGRELWKSDGTAAGTVLVADIVSGTGNSNPVSLTAAGNLLFFDAFGPGLGSLELFAIDTSPPAEIQVEQPVGTILVDNVSSINVGSPALGGSAVSKSFTIKNIGTQTLTITGVTGDGADIASFSFPTLVGTSIPAAGSAVFTVSLNPTSLGAKTAAIHIENTDSDENPFDIALAGNVIALPEIQVEQPAGTVKLDGSSTVAFGDSVLGVGVTKTFTISNVGSSSLSVTSITVDGANSGDFVTPAFGGTVPNGSSATLDVTFTPSATGARAAVLHVNSDDADEGSYDITLVGIGSAPAGLLKLARDINQIGAAPGITSMVLMGGSAYFAATTPDAGTELWKTDGTAAGTVMVKDIASGTSSSSPASLTVIGSTLYFAATDIINGVELWKSDGTTAGTVMVKDIFSGSLGSGPASLTNAGGTLFFSATDSTANGIELWKSDGTSAGTVLVLNINPTANTSSNPTNLTAVGSTLFLSANDGTNGAELWKSDGTAAGTVLVLNIHTTAGTGSFPANLTAVGSTLFFSATDATNGTELWKSDGTTAGTVLVKDIFAGVTGSSPAVLVNAAGTLFFRANTTAAGTELWKSDGTAAGTVQVKDIFAGTSSSTPASLFPVGTLVYFSATDGVSGIELWKSDGTTAGTVMVADINPGSASSIPGNFALVGTTLYFSATTASGSTELWQTDGTLANTLLVLDINPGAGASSPAALVNLGGSLVFVANDGTNGTEIWKSGIAGTSLVKDLVPGSNSAAPALLTLMNGVVYFSASDGVNGTELWRSDGTLAGTSMLKDISAGASSGNPTGLTVIGSMLYFAAFDSANGTELWKSDGTAAGTVLVANIASGSTSSSPANLTNVNGMLFFSASDAINGIELWRSDGTAAGTVLVKDINATAGTGSSPANLTEVNGTLFFSANDGVNGTELWKSDGTSGGSVMVLDINSGISASSPGNFRGIANTLFFSASTTASGTELWKSDGTAGGTVLVKEIAASTVSSSPGNLTAVGSALFFTANDNLNGNELWKSDGTAAGTVLVKDILAGLSSSSPAGLINVNGTLYFSANEFTTNVELWKSDGTAAGTVLVKDIFTGSSSSFPAGLVNAYGMVYFRANTTAAGTELWKSDGTAAGTVLASDVRPGALSSTPSNLMIVGGNLFFSAAGPDLGTELWVYDLGISAVAQEIQVEQPAATILTDGVSVIDLGTTAVGLPVAKTFTIRNLGTQNLVISAISGDGLDIGSITFPALTGTVIAGGGSTTFSVTFNPVSTGTKSAAIHIGSNDADENPFDISLTGTGVTAVPEIVVEQPVASDVADGGSRSFGAVATSSTASLTFTIKNIGTASLTGLTITKDGTDQSMFSVTSNPVAPVGFGASTTFTVSFTPTSTGPKTAAIHIANNDADENPFDINLTGTGAAALAMPFTEAFANNSAGWTMDAGWAIGPAIAGGGDPGVDNTPTADNGISGYVIGGTTGTAIFTARYLTSPVIDTNVAGNVSLEFYRWLNADYPPFMDSTIEVWNGSAWIQIFAVPSSTPYSESAWTRVQYDVTAYKNAAFRVRFGVAVTSTSAFDRGSWNIDDLRVLANGPEIAVEQPSGTDLTDGVSTSSFGSVPTGSNTSLVFTVRNTGVVDLTGLGITIDGTNSADFSVTVNPTAPVVPTGSTSFTVRFAPTATGVRTAALHIASNDVDENPFDINLTGTGALLAAPEIAVEQPVGTNVIDGGSKNFGSIATSATVPLTFTIKNIGTANLTGLTITKDGADQSMFTVTANPVAPVSGPAGSTTFTVSFAPTSVGTKNAAIHIASNDADENPFDINLTGTGVNPSSSTVFYEGFEGPGFTNPAWSTVNTTHAATFPTSGAAVGSACLSLQRISGSNTHYQGASATFTPSQPDYVSWRVRTPAINNTAYFVLGDAATTTNNGIVFAFFSGTTGALRFVTGTSTGYDYPGTLVDTWYQIEMKNINWTTKTYDLWINGVAVQTAIGFRSTASTSMSNLHLYNFGAGAGVYDEIIIGAPPSAGHLVSSPLGDVISGGGAPNTVGTASIGSFDVLRRGGYLGQNGALVFPGYLLIGSGSPPVTIDDFQGIWKDAGSGLVLFARTGSVAPGTTGVFDVLPQTPAINDAGQVTIMAALRVGTGGVTVSDDTGIWSEIGGGLSLLLRENDGIPSLPGVQVGGFATGAFATASTGAGTGEAAFSITMKGASTDTAILRTSVSGSATAVQVVARENTPMPGVVPAEVFGNLAGSYSDPARMDAAGNLAFAALSTTNKESLWYQPVAPAGGQPVKVFMAGDTAPGTGGATFTNLKSPAMGDGGTVTFRGTLAANTGDNTGNLRNDGIWRGVGSNAASYSSILRRGDAGLPGMPLGSKVGNLWHGWLTNGNHGAWLGWLDVNGDGSSSAAAGDVNAIFTDESGTMSMLLKVGDAAPGIAGASFSSFDLSVVGGSSQSEFLAFLGKVTGGGTTAANNQGVWRSAGGSPPTLVLRTGDLLSTTQGTKTVQKVDFPGSGNTVRRWEQPVIDGTGRLLIYVTFVGGATCQVIVP